MATETQLLFSEGLSLRSTDVNRKQQPGRYARGFIPFDDEKLGSCIDYLSHLHRIDS